MHNASTVKHSEGCCHRRELLARVCFCERLVLLQVLTKVAVVAVLHHYAYAELPELEWLVKSGMDTHNALVLQRTHDLVLFQRKVPLSTVENVDALQRYEP
jgi:hypothetical protein